MDRIRCPFERTRAAIGAGLRDGSQPGAQLCVQRAGEVLIDEAFGMARLDVPMTPASITLWFSAGKPLTAVAIAQLVEQGKLGWDVPVADVIPEFAAQGKHSVTVRQLLTHTAGLRPADQLDATLPWADVVSQICASPMEASWVPGQRAGYHLWATWQILGELVRRTSGEDISEYVQKHILAPLRMMDSCLAVPKAPEMQARMAFVYDTSGAEARPRDEWNLPPGVFHCRPGGSARGPVRALAQFYETLRRGGQNVLRPETVALMTARQRQGMFDETFQFKMDCGLGFILNSNHGGFQMPYGYGRHASRNTFGHSGHQSSCAFCDPEHELVVAWACNGQPGERRHQQRQRAINNAIYEDLGLTQDSTP